MIHAGRIKSAKSSDINSRISEMMVKRMVMSEIIEIDCKRSLISAENLLSVTFEVRTMASKLGIRTIVVQNESQPRFASV